MSEELQDKQSKLPQRSSETRASRIILSVVILLGSIFSFIATQLLAVIIVGGTTGSILGLSAEKIEELLSENVVVLGVYVVSSLLLIAILAFVCMLAKRNFFDIVGLHRKPQWGDVAWASLTYVGYFILFAILATVFFPLLQQVINVEQEQSLGVNLDLTIINAIVLFAMFVIIPPLIEEILFRGFMYRTVRKLLPKWVAILSVSLLFGAMHLEFFGDNPLNWVAMIDTTILSVALIFVVEKTNSLWPAIYVHAIKNLVAYTLLLSGIAG